MTQIPSTPIETGGFVSQVLELGADRVKLVSTPTFEESASRLALYQDIDRDSLRRHIATHAAEGELLHATSNAQVRQLAVSGRTVMYMQTPGSVFLLAVLDGRESAFPKKHSVALHLSHLVHQISNFLRSL